MVALLTNLISASPKGLLAQARDLYDVKIPAAYERLQVFKVGPIEMSGNRELGMLAKQGRRLVGAICSALFVKRGQDVFNPSGGGGGWEVGDSFPSGAPGGSGDNWVGK
jgi:hypothetical protein